MVPVTRSGKGEENENDVPPEVVVEGCQNKVDPEAMDERADGAPVQEPEPTRLSEAERLSARLQEELESLRRDYRKLSRDMDSLLDGRCAPSMEREYERLAHFNSRSASDPYRKPALTEPTTFDGTNLEANPYALRIWIRDVFDFTTQNFPEDEGTQVRYAMRLLQGEARQGMGRWLSRAQEEGRPLTMVEWATHLRRILQPTDPAMDAQREWENARMFSTETAYQYFTRLDTYAECINAAGPECPTLRISDMALASHYRHTLSYKLRARVDAQVRLMMNAKATLPRSPEDWMDLAMAMEQTMKNEELEEKRQQRALRKSGAGPSRPRQAALPRMRVLGTGEDTPRRTMVGPVYHVRGSFKK
ncbi:MAG: hypothetical protein ACO33E_06285, partial [Aquiluna sp.]